MTAPYLPRVLALLASWDGISANPTAANDGWNRYRAIVAGGETYSAAHDMTRESGCALVVRGYWRTVLARPPACLLAPYVTGRALADVASAAHAAGAVRTPAHRPEPGDVVHVGASAGAPEHVYIVTAVDPQPNPYDGWDIDSIDGGQRDGGWECIRARARVWVPQDDCAAWWDDEVGGPNRPIVAAYSLAAMVVAFGDGTAEAMLRDPL